MSVSEESAWIQLGVKRSISQNHFFFAPHLQMMAAVAALNALATTKTPERNCWIGKNQPAGNVGFLL